MAVSTFTLKVNAQLHIGEAPESAQLLLRTNFNGVVNFAGADGTYVPGGQYDLPGGVRDFELPHTNIPGAQPEDYRHWAWLKVALPGRESQMFGPFEVDAPVGTTVVWLNDCGPATNVPAEWSDPFRDEMETVKSLALSLSAAEADRAQAAAQYVEQVVIEDLGTSDSQMAAVAATPPSSFRTQIDKVIGQAAQQTDFIALAERFSPYRTMEIRKVATPYAADPTLEVSCLAPDGRHITYEIANSTGGVGSYRIVSRIWEGATTPTYLPVGATDITVDNGVFDWRPAEAVRTGSGWNTSATYYTTTVGDYFESPAPVPVTGGSAKVSFHSFSDNRGGIWRLSVVGHPELGTKDVSVWSSSAVLTLQADVWTIPDVPAGSYTFRAAFQGDDPAHVPSSGAGTARGWMGTAVAAQFIVRVSDLTPARTRANALKATFSNPDIALSIRPGAGGTYRYWPDHAQGQVVEVPVSTKFYDGLTEINVAAMGVGSRRAVTSFEMVQTFRARNTTGGTELAEITTKQRITPDGVHRVDGSVKILASTDISADSYAMMHVVNPTIFDRLVSSWGNTYSIDKTSHPDGTTTQLDTEKNRAISWAAVSATSPDLIAVMRFNNLVQTLRMNTATHEHPLWIEHRNATLAKLYPRLGFTSGQVLAPGTVLRFSGDFFYGRLPGAASVIAP